MADIPKGPTCNQWAAACLLEVAVKAVRDALGELARDKTITTKDYNAIERDLAPGKIAMMQNALMRGVGSEEDQ